MSQIEYNGIEYPVIEQNGLRFAVIPSGLNFYKAMRENNLVDYFTREVRPYPNFYSDIETARKTGAKVYKFLTTRPAKLLILNDSDNITELSTIFSYTSGIRGVLKRSRKGAVRELVASVTDMTGEGIKKNTRESLEELDIKLTSGNELSPVSKYAINLQVSKNICRILKDMGGDGFIVSSKEVMFCFTTECVKN